MGDIETAKTSVICPPGAGASFEQMNLTWMRG